jgi:outer membrane protein insertion porin family
MKRFVFYIVLWMGMGLLPAVAAQPAVVDSLTHRPPALERVEVRIQPKIKEKIRISTSRYRLHPIKQSLIRRIQQEITGQLHRFGYYLARLDSFRVQRLADTSRAQLTLFVNPGKKFVVGAIQLQFSDSIDRDMRDELELLKRDFTGQPFTESWEKGLFSALIKKLENNGYPLARIETEKMLADTVLPREVRINLHLKVVPGPRVSIAGLRIPYSEQVDLRYLERIFHFRAPQLYREEQVQRFRQILVKQEFVEAADEPQLVLANDSLYYLYLPFKLAPATALDGIVGYVPPPANQPQQRGYFTGMFRVELRNLFGTGRLLNIAWKKPDRFSEEFHLRYREPFILGLPFHAGAELHRIIRDTTYIEWEYALNGEIPLHENVTAIFRVFTRDVYPDSLASAVQRLPRTHALRSELGFRFDNRDEPFNPTRGMVLRLSVDYGQQQNLGPTYLLVEDSLARKTDVTRMRARLSLYRKIWKRQVLAWNVQAGFVGNTGQPVRMPDMFWFGGASSVRGYRENQFVGERVVWSNLEYWFLLGPRSRFFLFWDWASYARKYPEEVHGEPMGFGLGIRIPGPLGIMQVDYGLARGSSFRDGMIHFRIINTF